eukprot:3449492-Amphidinium_carterae.4
MTKKAKTKRPGRTWRAFLHVAARGSVGRPNMTQLGHMYRTEGKYQDTALVRLGKLATESLQERRPGHTSFGPRMLYVKRAVQKQRGESFWLRTSALPIMDRATEMARVAKMKPTNIKGAIQLANKQLTLDAHQRRERIREEMNTLQEYEEKHGQNNLAKLGELLPRLRPLLSCMTAVPSPGGMLFDVKDLVSMEATHAVAWASSSHKKSNLGVSLEKEWKCMHVPKAHGAHVPLDAGKAASICQTTGVCVCSDEGKKILKFRQAVWQNIKQTFAGKLEKDKISSGRMFMRFAHENAIAEIEGSRAVPEVWIHVGFMMWKPMVLSCQRMKRVQVPDFAQLPGQDASSICLKAALQFCDEWHAWKDLDLQQAWTLSYYILESSERGLEKLCPKYVSVVAYKQLQELHLWPTKRKPSKRKTRPASAGNMSSVVHPVPVDEVSDESLDEEEEGGNELLELEENAAEDEEDNNSEDDCLEDLLWRTAEMAEETPKLQSEADEGAREASSTMRDGLEHPAFEAAHVEASLATTMAACIDVGNGARSSTDQAPNIALGPEVPCMGAEDGVSGSQPAACIAEPASQRSPQRDLGRKGPSDKATATLEVEGGRISYYAKKESFEAVCKNKAHSKCVLTRTAKGRRRKGRDGLYGGRPVAFMTLWLSRHECATKQEHWSTEQNMFTWTERHACRELLGVMPDAQALMCYEREPEPNEGSEPKDLFGMWP